MTAPSARPIRPRGARIVSGVLFVVLPVGGAVLILAMHRVGTMETHYTMSIVFIVIAAMTFLAIQFAVVAKPSSDGVYIRNLIKRYQLDWAEIISVRFSPDRPWAQLDLSDGQAVNVMAIQAADGAYARAGAERLAAWVRTGEGKEPPIG